MHGLRRHDNMKKYCMKCDKEFDTESFFCPKCRNMFRPNMSKEEIAIQNEIIINSGHPYIVKEWIPSMLRTLCKHSGEFSTKKDWYDIWKRETPGAPRGGMSSDRSGSFYANARYFFEAKGIMIWKNGHIFVKDVDNGDK